MYLRDQDGLPETESCSVRDAHGLITLTSGLFDMLASEEEHIAGQTLIKCAVIVHRQQRRVVLGGDDALCAALATRAREGFRLQIPTITELYVGRVHLIVVGAHSQAHPPFNRQLNGKWYVRHLSREHRLGNVC